MSLNGCPQTYAHYFVGKGVSYLAIDSFRRYQSASHKNRSTIKCNKTGENLKADIKFQLQISRTQTVT